MCVSAGLDMPGGSRAARDDALAGLSRLCRMRAAEMPAMEMADCLRDLERAESLLTAARASVLAAFIAQDGCADDGHGSARTWLTWQTRVTRGAAAGAVGWVRRLAAHPVIGKALEDAAMSASWARQICDWTDRLPQDRREDADVILARAAAAGADLAGLAGLAEEMLRRCASPDQDGDGFADRSLRLERTFGGAGRLGGDLTPRCAAALAAVLEALGGRAGPEDDRARDQRDHDALEEVCRRLLGAGCLPDRAGQPAQLRLHMSLEQLTGQPVPAQTRAAWSAAGWSAAGHGDDCDAQVAPQVSGQPDPVALDRLTSAWLAAHGRGSGAGPGGPDGDATRPAAATPTATARMMLSRTLLGLAVDALSGPSGLAAYLRAGLLTGPAAAPSLPLDLGRPTEIIPAHLRRAVTSRDTRCVFPGCDQPPAVCQVHHLVPRAEGGTTALTNLILLCSFHHLIAVHRWGWQLTLHPDGTVTATSPDRNRVLHGHGPPPPRNGHAAAS